MKTVVVATILLAIANTAYAAKKKPAEGEKAGACTYEVCVKNGTAHGHSDASQWCATNYVFLKGPTCKSQ